MQATQDTLNSCRDVGVMFGQTLAEALMLPLTAFNKLRSGIDWVLEKLGVINKDAATLDQTAAKAGAVAAQGGGGAAAPGGPAGASYQPVTSAYPGYQSYQPVTAPAGRSYVDQSRSEYNISLQGGGAPGGNVSAQLREELERHEREKRARARASMMHDGE